MSVNKTVISAEDKFAAALVPAEEQPYQVPENWCWTNIQYVATRIKRGKSPKYVPHSSIPVFAQKCNQKDGTISMEKAQYLNPEMLQKLSEDEFLMDEDIIINSTGTGTLGRVGFYRESYAFPYSTVLPDSHITVVRAAEHINRHYLYSFLKSKQNDLELMGVGSTNQKELRPESIGSISLPLPPLLEQHRIVNHIEFLFAQLDEAQAEAQAVIDGYEHRKAAILRRAFTGELTAQLAQQRVAEWQSVSLKDVVAGFKYGTSEKSDYANSGLPVLRIPNVGDGIIDFSDIKYLEGDTDTGNYVRENDVLIIRSNGSRDLVGKCAIVPSTEQQYAYASFLIKIIPSAKVLPDYLVLFLNSADARAQMFAKAKSSAGIHNINSKELGAIQMPLPEAWEQQEIVRIANELIKKESAAKAAAEQAIAQIDVMKKSILARAFRGELGTNDPNDEPAIELLKRTLETRT